MKPRTLAILAAAALLVGCATPPPDAADDRIYRGISLVEMQEAMQQMGLRAEHEREGEQEWINSGTSGYHFKVYLYDCDPTRVCDDIQVRAWFEFESPLTLADVNRWNSEKRFAKVYLDHEGDLAIEMDLPARGGVTRGEIRYFLDVWDVMLNELAGFPFGEAADGSGAGSP